MPRSLLHAVLLANSVLLAWPVAVRAQSVVVAAGGGTEGDQGDTTSWSYQLYKELIGSGDTNSDGSVRVAIIATSLPNRREDREWLPAYFEWIGSTLGLSVEAAGYEVASRSDANDAALVGPIENADIIFIKGGDQGVYYDEWNDTLLEQHIRTVVKTRNGAVGGTSAGAMSLAQYCFAPEKDMISTDVLHDAHTSYMDDADGGSGIHTDFLSFVSGVYIETHYTWRGRLGRAVGILGKAVDDFADPSILAVAIEEYTGVVIRDGVAEVHGHGEVAVIRGTHASTLIREPGRPLVYTNLVLDRLADGWRYDLNRRAVIPPTDAESVTYPGDGEGNHGDLVVSGATDTDQYKFEWIASYDPYNLVPTSNSTYVRNGVAFTDALNQDNRGYKHETIFRALYDVPSSSGFLLYNDTVNGVTGTISRSADVPDLLAFGPDLASIVLDGASITYKGLASRFESKNGVQNTAALANVTMHVLADSKGHHLRYNSRTHELVRDTVGHDAVPPVISAIAAENVGTTTADILWTTDEPATTTIRYGTSSGAYPGTFSDTLLVTDHRVRLHGLHASTTYYYVVESTDGAGNTATSAEHRFTTLTETGVDVMFSTISLSTELRGAHPNAVADVHVTAHGQPVGGAAVRVTWSGSFEGTDYGGTDSAGRVVFTSGTTRSRTWDLTLTIDDVAKEGFVWDAARSETRASIGSTDVGMETDGDTVLKVYPNPFNPATVVAYTVHDNGPISVRVYDVLGRPVKILVEGDSRPGTYHVRFDASGLAGGLYLLRLRSSRSVHTRRLVFVR